MAPQPPPVRPRARIVGVIAFLVGFSLSLSLVRVTARPDPVETGRSVLHEKFEALRTRTSTPDIVFVGNSHVHRTVVPAVFDGRMAELGCTVTSYNLGVVGLRRNELPSVLDAIDALRGGPPPYVVIGPALQLDIAYEGLSDLSTRSFYRSKDLGALVGRWQATDGIGGRNVPYVVGVYLGAQVPVGALHHLLHPERAQPVGAPPLLEAARRDGYLSLEDEAPFDPAIAAREADLDAFVASGGFAAALDPGRDATIDTRVFVSRWEDRLEAVGRSTPILLQEPSVFYREAAQVEAAFRRANPTVPVVNLSTPERLPQHLDPDEWFDRTHVRRGFAEAASVELANQMCPIVQADRGTG